MSALQGTTRANSADQVPKASNGEQLCLSRLWALQMHKSYDCRKARWLRLACLLPTTQTAASDSPTRPRWCLVSPCRGWRGEGTGKEGLAQDSPGAEPAAPAVAERAWVGMPLWVADWVCTSSFYRGSRHGRLAKPKKRWGHEAWNLMMGSAPPHPGGPKDTSHSTYEPSLSSMS